MLQHFIVIQRTKLTALQDTKMLRCPAVRSIETFEYLEMCPMRNKGFYTIQSYNFNQKSSYNLLI
jgi:hypothetical protein